MFEVYAQHKLLVWCLVVGLSVACCIGHFVFCRQHSIDSLAGNDGLVKRFSRRELVTHWLVLLGFFFLAITGFRQFSNYMSEPGLGPLHGWIGFIFLIITLALLIPWIPQTRFKAYDIPWLKNMGGYLSDKPSTMKAGRFNAGQKIFYWLMLLTVIGLFVSALIMEQGHGPHSQADRETLFWCIHGLIGCIATAMVIGHGYLSMVVNKPTARVLWDGKVSESYVRIHHSQWKPR